MGRIPEETIEKVKEMNDIVDIVSEKVRLKRAGSNYTGLCPFHNEKTPSFIVSPSKQIYKCFGCGEGGNVITFLMKTRSLSFEEAVRELAKKSGITIEETSAKADIARKRRETLENMNKTAARFFYENLKKDKRAMEYFLKRGIRMETIVRFGLGYSNDSWDSLVSHLKEKGFSDNDIRYSGLVSGIDKGKCYDRFRNRVMYPVFDYRNRVIGFGARVLDDSKPKYLNSPDTMLFRKGTNLYGLNLYLKEKGPREDYFIVVEGYMDCISLHQAGITNAVAALGTAFTQAQARLMKRFVSKVVVCFDADTAGLMATERGMDILSQEGFDIRILRVPDGKDPDEFLKNHTREDFLELVDKALSLTDFRLENASRGLDLKKESDKVKYFEKIMPYLREMGEIEKDLYVTKLSDRLGISRASIMSMVKGENRKAPVFVSKTPASFVESGQIKAERYLLGMLCKGNRTVLDHLRDERLATEVHRKIFDLIKDFEGDPADLNPYVESYLTEADEISEWVEITNLDSIPDDIDTEKLIEDYASTVKHFNLRNRQRKLLERISELEKSKDAEGLVEAAKELVKIQKQLGGQ